MHLECSTESEAHTLSFHTVLSGNTEETMKHIGVTGAKHKWSTGVIAMRSFLRTICYCGSAEKALPPNPHHLCRFMDNVVLTYLKVQNIFSYLLIQCILISPSSKDCKKKNFCELHFVPAGRTFGDVLDSSQAICSRLLHGCSETWLGF